MLRVCMFCQFEGKLTDEHVVSEWIIRMLADRAKFPDIADGEYRSEFQRDKTTVALLENADIDVIAKSVCSDCNTGWMSDVEVQAIPILGPMICGKQMIMDSKKIKAIAPWFALKSLLLRYAGSKDQRMVPEREWVDSFYKSRTAPEAMVLLLGKYGPSRNDSLRSLSRVNAQQVEIVDHFRDGSTKRAPNNIVSTFQFGYLVAKVVWTAGVPVLKSPPAELDEVWPLKRFGLIWPPPVSVNRASLDRLCEWPSDVDSFTSRTDW